MVTPHINAENNAFAETILLPGDPLRAKFIADTFFQKTKEVTNVRNILGFTGEYKGSRISVMGTGMGIPSISIYAKELITEYKVKSLIRVGSSGSIAEHLELGDIVVGVGASRVRDMFEQGKKHSPCIIFIDEIDAVGRSRGAGLGGGNDEREQTLNQLLVEMDGFDTNEGIILIAATNRPDVLDPALLRPGRFDRIIKVPNPDEKGRQHIFEIHTKSKPLASDAKISEIVKLTDNFSGAEIAAVANRAAIAALRRYVSGKSKNVKEIKITQQDLIDAVDKVKPRKREDPIPQVIK